MSNKTNDNGGLSRWSKRKLAVAEEAAAEEDIAESDTADDEEAAARQAELDAELQANREAAEAVDLDNMDEETDFSVFMKSGVPEMLKKQAMASLWRTNPVFANIDGLVDYDDDFGSPDLIMKTFKSAYQAGRGYLDLFKEKEEVEEDDADGLAVDDKSSETTEDLAAQSGEDQADDVSAEIPEDETEMADAETVELVIDEPEFVETAPLPKVSLRRRLELDA